MDLIEIGAEALGAELAHSVKARAAMPGAGITGFAATMAIDPERLQDELAYLSIVTMHFCVSAGLAPDVTPRVLGLRLPRLVGRGFVAGPPGRSGRDAHRPTRTR